MLLKPFLLAAALAMPTPWSSDISEETDEDRAARVAVITDSIAEECPEPWLAIAALVKMHAESGGFRLDVHDGRRRGDQGRSVCLGQIWGGGPELMGVDPISTRLCARMVTRHLGWHFVRCRFGAVNEWSVAGMYAGYGTGHSCNPQFLHKDTGRPFGLDRAQAWGRLWSAFTSQGAQGQGVGQSALAPAFAAVGSWNIGLEPSGGIEAVLILRRTW